MFCKLQLCLVLNKCHMNILDVGPLLLGVFLSGLFSTVWCRMVEFIFSIY